GVDGVDRRGFAGHGGRLRGATARRGGGVRPGGKISGPGRLPPALGRDSRSTATPPARGGRRGIPRSAAHRGVGAPAGPRRRGPPFFARVHLGGAVIYFRIFITVSLAFVRASPFAVGPSCDENWPTAAFGSTCVIVIVPRYSGFSPYRTTSSSAPSRISASAPRVIDTYPSNTFSTVPRPPSGTGTTRAAPGRFAPDRRSFNWLFIAINWFWYRSFCFLIPSASSRIASALASAFFWAVRAVFRSVSTR